MKTLLCSLLLLCSPASALAQSFYPNLAALRYCDLRSAGVVHEQAMRIALLENWDSERPSISVTAHGVNTSTDVLDFVMTTRKCNL